MELDLEAIAASVGALLSLFLKYTPIVKDLFDQFPPWAKVTYIVALVSAGAFLFGVTGLVSWPEAVLSTIFALIGSQTTHQLTRKL